MGSITVSQYTHVYCDWAAGKAEEACIAIQTNCIVTRGAGVGQGAGLGAGRSRRARRGSWAWARGARGLGVAWALGARPGRLGWPGLCTRCTRLDFQTGFRLGIFPESVNEHCSL